MLQKVTIKRIRKLICELKTVRIFEYYRVAPNNITFWWMRHGDSLLELDYI